ncbi:TPA: hypothetical protein DEB00_00755 [Candidatus Uhrbacteria bacterium]|nr:hypothetical protein [Candidatus Uhrbacteria bacterium]
MTLALQLVTYNSAAYLPFLFDSLIGQTDCDWVLYILDNSQGEERERIRLIVEQYSQRLPTRLEESPDNCGFAGGHQRLFTRHDADLVQLVNPDTILSASYIEVLRQAFEAWEELGSAAGIILRWDWKEGTPCLSDLIDSLGLSVSASGKVFDVVNGENVTPDAMRQVFGVSGCLPMVRREAVERASCDGRLFDPSYVVYKEDVDLAYRLYADGWISALVPEAVAHHRRAFRLSLLHRDASRFVQFYSYRNHLWNLIVYTSVWEGIRRSWALIPFELSKLAFLLVFHPSIVRDTIRDTKHAWPILLKKRAFYVS